MQLVYVYARIVIVYCTHRYQGVHGYLCVSEWASVWVCMRECVCVCVHVLLGVIVQVHTMAQIHQLLKYLRIDLEATYAYVHTDLYTLLLTPCPAVCQISNISATSIK